MTKHFRLVNQQQFPASLAADTMDDTDPRDWASRGQLGWWMGGPPFAKWCLAATWRSCWATISVHKWLVLGHWQDNHVGCMYWSDTDNSIDTSWYIMLRQFVCIILYHIIGALYTIHTHAYIYIYMYTGIDTFTFFNVVFNISSRFQSFIKTRLRQPRRPPMR